MFLISLFILCDNIYSIFNMISYLDLHLEDGDYMDAAEKAKAMSKPDQDEIVFVILNGLLHLPMILATFI